MTFVIVVDIIESIFDGGIFIILMYGSSIMLMFVGLILLVKPVKDEIAARKPGETYKDVVKRTRDSRGSDICGAYSRVIKFCQCQWIYDLLHTLLGMGKAREPIRYDSSVSKYRRNQY